MVVNKFEPSVRRFSMSDADDSEVTIQQNLRVYIPFLQKKICITSIRKSQAHNVTNSDIRLCARRQLLPIEVHHDTF
jgi:hypothetical protein